MYISWRREQQLQEWREREAQRKDDRRWTLICDTVIKGIAEGATREQLHEMLHNALAALETDNQQGYVSKGKPEPDDEREKRG